MKTKVTTSKERVNPYPTNIFCPENVVCFYVCCIYSDALRNTHALNKEFFFQGGGGGGGPQPDDQKTVLVTV